MPGVTLEILIILLMIVANGVFSMSEIAIVSSRKARLQQRANRGDKGAEAALDLAGAPNRFLATAQIGITLVGIFAGAFGGATVAEKLATALRAFPPLAPYSNAVALAAVVLMITYLSLVIGELVPKRVALNSPEQIAAIMARPMQGLSRLASPAVRLLSGSTDLLIRLLRIRPAEEPPVTEEEITLLIAQGAKAGVFEKAEQDIVARLFRLGDQTAGSLMTPRRRIAWLDLNDLPERNREKIMSHTHTRFVVCQDTLDSVLGIVSTKDLLAQCAAGEPIDFTKALRKPHFLPEGTRALRVLELFKSSRMHIALVMDEYGSVAGLLTLNDILEGIVGEMPAPGEPVNPRATQRQDGSWLVDGLLGVEEFKELFGLPELPGENTGNFRTLGGFVATQMGRIPAPGDSFNWSAFRFEVLDMDGSRVDKVLVQPPTVRAAS